MKAAINSARMRSSLDRHFRRWLKGIARKWRMTEAKTAPLVAGDEIANRTQQYQLLQDELRRQRLDMAKISRILHD